MTRPHADTLGKYCILDELGRGGFARLLSDNSLSLSLSGGILGTPAYIAPEVWELDVGAPPATRLGAAYVRSRSYR